MIENTADDRRTIAAEAVASFGDAFVIETEEELVKVFKEYARRDLMHRMSDFDTDSPGHTRHMELTSNMYADLNSNSFAHDLPAILFLLSRYRGQQRPQGV